MLTGVSRPGLTDLSVAGVTAAGGDAGFCGTGRASLTESVTGASGSVAGREGRDGACWAAGAAGRVGAAAGGGGVSGEEEGTGGAVSGAERARDRCSQFCS
ncbi:hypothetical protein GCM10027079_29370 [Sediminivirga luteola]|uniref:Uncharacterized protein n=1 Tax=Sediminivirga luteola TaxID=1774748 RepID=A0A8J2XJK2_9MICO|nr:hypothetical protein GCM10011333_24640 [Sediminivirga luteola]